MSDIKIFVSNRIDLDSRCIDNELFVPVRCGAVFDKRKNVTMLGDDTGDNISNKRMSYCELTVQYWAWKNVKADYYGLCHYRRYLSFSDKRYTPNYSLNDCADFETLDEKSIHELNLDNEKLMRDMIEQYDIVTNEYMDIRNKYTFRGYKNTILDHWIAHDGYLIKKETLDILVDIIKTDYSEYYHDAMEYLNGHEYRGFNCFVMKRPIFFKFCEFEFVILSKIEKSIDMSRYSEAMMKTPGFMGELLYGIFIYHLEKQKKYGSSPVSVGEKLVPIIPQAA